MATPLDGDDWHLEAVVHFKEKKLQVRDPSTTLQDLCVSAGISWEDGVHVVCNDGTPRASHPTDLVIPVDRPLKRRKRESADDADDSDVEALTLVKPSKRGDGDAQPSSSSGPLKLLAELGILPLLSSQSPSQIAASDWYNPDTSPQYLRNILYDSSTFSPHRGNRDPLAVANRQQILSGAAAELLRTTSRMDEEADSTSVREYKSKRGYFSGIERYEIPLL